MDAAERVGYQLSDRASVRSGIISRQTAALATGATATQSVRLGAPFVASMVTGRGFFSSALDDTTMVTTRWENPAQAGYLLGDTGGDLNLSIIAEVSTPYPLPKPWIIWPAEDHRWTVTCGTMAGTAKTTVGLSGLWLSGFGSGA